MGSENNKDLDKNALRNAVRLLPFAFMLHNGEEALTVKSWIKEPLTEGQYPAGVMPFVIAVTLFTVLGFIIVFVKTLYQEEQSFFFCMGGFSGMVLLNVFFPHLVGAVLYQTYMPGLYTAIGINLPLTVYILYLLRKPFLLGTKDVIRSVAAGGLVGIILVRLFLTIGSVIATAT